MRYRLSQTLTACMISLAISLSVAAQTPTMIAHFIDMGQADATLLEFPCGVAMIDAGAQDADQIPKLITYLDEFFSRRADLNRTIDMLFITHTHIDHNQALQAVAQGFNVKRYIDNGMVVGSGRHKAQWIRDAVEHGEVGTTIRTINDGEVQSADHSIGLTDHTIEPFQCDACDPRITVLSASLKENPGWPDGEFENQNNHSLVIRVDFGEASFLFTGDMEEDALDTLVNYYEDSEHQSKVLDVDVYHVGHHGSYNGTTEDLLKAMSPTIAVISMGAWNFGKEPPVRFSTWNYGHPRESLIEELERSIKRKRTNPEQVHVFSRAQKPKIMGVTITGYSPETHKFRPLVRDLRKIRSGKPLSRISRSTAQDSLPMGRRMFQFGIVPFQGWKEMARNASNRKAIPREKWVLVHFRSKVLNRLVRRYPAQQRIKKRTIAHFLCSPYAILLGGAILALQNIS